MNFIDDIFEKAKSNIKRIALPESTDERILQACIKIKEQNLAEPILIGNKEEIQKKANELNLNLENIQIRDTIESENYASKLFELRKEKGLTLEQAKILVQDSVYLATMLLKDDEVDGVVSGAIHSTADTLRPALQIIKTKADIKTASSFFFMILNDKTYFFADCGFVIDPDEDQLADIAMCTAKSARKFNIEPKVAFLSFSTHGSAKHEKVDKVKNAVNILTKRNPDFIYDGELQLDAAIIPKVAELKAPNSPLKGEANVLIFPDLAAGNIGYKLVQRLGGATALGPIVQGLKKPVNDLSRGCSIQDIIDVVAITAVQAQMNSNEEE